MDGLTRLHVSPTKFGFIDYDFNHLYFVIYCCLQIPPSFAVLFSLAAWQWMKRFNLAGSLITRKLVDEKVCEEDLEFPKNYTSCVEHTCAFDNTCFLAETFVFSG